MLGFLQLMLIGLVVAVVLGSITIVRTLRRPPRRSYAWAVARKRPGDPSEVPPPTGPREFRSFTFDAPASRRGSSRLALPAWEIVGDDTNGPLVIYTPGWGDSKQGVLDRLSALAPIASRIVAWDPAGEGEAPSSCNLGTDADVQALLSLVRECAAPGSEAGALCEPTPTVLFGSSLGAGVSIVAAARLGDGPMAPIGVIAEAPYRLAHTPVRNYLRLMRAPVRLTAPLATAWLGLQLRGTMDWTTFDRALFAKDLRCPLLVLHGTHDEICPHSDGQHLAAVARRSLFISIEGAGHNNLWSEERFRAPCAHAIRDFVWASRGATRV